MQCLLSARKKVNEFAQSRKLEKVTQAPFFSLNGLHAKMKVVHVYDGDTIHGIIILHCKPVKFKIRMMGYDSPEMKPPLNQENREEEKRAALEAKNAISELILDKVVDVHFFDFDKYGRPLADVYTVIDKSKVKVNDWMIQNGHGYHYEGKTKMKFSNNI